MLVRGLRFLLRHSPFYQPAVALARRRRYPALGLHPDVVDEIQGEFCYGSGVSVGSRARLVVPSGTKLELGDGVYIGRDVEVGVAGHIVIDDRTSLQDRCVILGDVRIGRYCVFSYNIYITSGNHNFRKIPHLLIRDQDDAVLRDSALAAAGRRPVVIGEDCWLGINTVVLAGVKIGRGAVVGANSVVTRDVAPYTIVGGTPARQIGTRLKFEPPARISWSIEQHLPYFYSGFQMADDQRCINASFGGLVATKSFELCLAYPSELLVIRIRAFDNGRTTVSHGEQVWQIDSEWSQIRVVRTAELESFAAVGAGVVVSEAWIE